MGNSGTKRPRTVKKVRSLLPTFNAASKCYAHEADIPGESESNCAERKAHTESELTVADQLTLGGFLEQLAEKAERENFETKAFSHKNKVSKHPLDFKTLYSESISGEIEPSNIYYMVLLDEPPDSADTMRHVADILLNTTTPKVPKWIIV